MISHPDLDLKRAHRILRLVIKQLQDGGFIVPLDDIELDLDRPYGHENLIIKTTPYLDRSKLKLEIPDLITSLNSWSLPRIILCRLYQNGPCRRDFCINFPAHRWVFQHTPPDDDQIGNVLVLNSQDTGFPVYSIVPVEIRITIKDYPRVADALKRISRTERTALFSRPTKWL